MSNSNNFEYVDLNSSTRADHFKLYSQTIQCTYSMTCDVDITALIELKHILNKRGVKISFYALVMYVLAKLVNSYDEFRYSLDEEQRLIKYKHMDIIFTCFHESSEIFSILQVNYDSDLLTFAKNYEQVIQKYGSIEKLYPMPIANNTFPVSCIPWVSFSAFNLNIRTSNNSNYLTPIFTFAKYYEKSNLESNQKEYRLPLSAQVHHAVIDGFHISRLFNKFEEVCNSLLAQINN